MASTYKDIQFLSIDMDGAGRDLSLNNDLIEAQQYEYVQSLPSFYFYKDGKIVDRVLGADIGLVKTKLNELKQA